MQNLAPALPHEGKHPLHCKDAVCKVLELCSAAWESCVAIPHTAWGWAGRENSSHESCAQVYKTERTPPMLPPKCPKKSNQIQAWKSKGGGKLMRPFYIQAYLFSVPVFFIYLKSIFHSTLEISSDKDTSKGLGVIMFFILNSPFSWLKVDVMCFGGNTWHPL